MAFTTREQIVELVNTLFIATDYQEWDRLQSDVFAEGLIKFDMSSAGGPNKDLSAAEICALWQQGFQDIDAINHLAGNFLVSLHGNTAHVFAYATATHYRAAATKGHTREFVGSYDIQVLQTPKGWRIDGFKYTLKYATGNTELR